MANIGHVLLHLGYIVKQKTRYPYKYHKVSLFISYIKMMTKKWVLVDMCKLNPKHEYFLGYFVYCYSYAQLVSLFEDIFIREEYYFPSPILQPTIIDGGSHIGMSVLYFKYLYPGAKIISFEPDPQTFFLFTKNIQTNKLASVKLINKGLAGDARQLSFYYDDKFPGSTVSSFIPTRHHTVHKKIDTVTISSHINRYVDLVKLDIEGMEQEVLLDLERTKKLRFVKAFTVEYHHHIPGLSDTLSLFLFVLERNNYWYQLSTSYKITNAQNSYQDILIYSKRKEMKVK